jgi:hypothetical protein
MTIRSLWAASSEYVEPIRRFSVFNVAPDYSLSYCLNVVAPAFTFLPWILPNGILLDIIS